MARPRKLDRELAHYADKGLKSIAIAREMGIDAAQVSRSLDNLIADKKAISSFNNSLPDYLSALLARFTQELSTKDLSKQSATQLVTSIAILIDKHRLITGQSTSNQAVLFHLVSEACKKDRNSSSGEDGEGGG